MTSEIKSCYIYSDDDSRLPILLADETPVIVGRDVATLITDTRCSRNQVRLSADYAAGTVTVQQIGRRPCGLNGFETRRDARLVARHGDCVEILYGLYRYRIEFNPPPSPAFSPSDGRCCKEINRSDEDLDLTQLVCDPAWRTNVLREDNKRPAEGDDLCGEPSQFERKDSGCSGAKRTNCEGRDAGDGVEESIRTASKRSKVESEEKNSSCGKDLSGCDKRDAGEIEGGKKKSGRDGMRKLGCGEESESSMAKKVRGASMTERDDAVKGARGGLWEEFGTLIVYTSAGVEGRSKIAGYDMDNTLIKTQSGLVFPKDENDWQILYAEVPGKLKRLHGDGYKIVIFTNQGALFVGKVKPSDFKLKIERVIRKLGVPVQAFVASGKDFYRKPRMGMWEKLVNDKNDGVSVDKARSFFVGDAAGRAKDWAPKKKKDHSSADRLLALNLGLTFQTPEEHFLGHKPAPYSLPEFDPKKSKFLPLYEPSSATLISPKQEVVLMVGGPGSGKSHIAKTHLGAYHYINRDKLGSWQKCVTALEKALSQGKSVVVDNTNPDVSTRQRYVNVAKSQGVPVRCFVMMTDKEHARHNNKFRELTDPSHMTVTDVIINSYSYTNSTFLWRCARFLKLLLLLCLRLFAGTVLKDVRPCRKIYVPPEREEGFEEIVRINCVPSFENEDHRRLYEMYLLEK